MTLHHLCFTPSAAPCALAIGNFDGLHRGHQKLFQQMQAYAQTHGLSASALSFYPHPLTVIAARRSGTSLEVPLPILDRYSKISGLRELGCQQLFLQRFSQAFAQMSALDFVQEVMLKQLNLRALFVGNNFRFGYQRSGDIELLQRLGSTLGFTVHPQALLTDGAQAISSGRIRRALQQNDFALAADLLGRPYALQGRVQHGQKLGRTLGIPTLNLAMPTNAAGRSLLNGIYVARVSQLEPDPSQQWPAVVSIGTRPSVETAGRALLEAHVFNYQGQCYGQRVRIEFCHYLRAEQKFDHLEALRIQMQADLAAARAWHGIV